MGRFFGPTPNVISAEGFFQGSAGVTTKTWTQVITGFEGTGTFFFGSYANGLYLITSVFGGDAQVISSPDLVSFVMNDIPTPGVHKPRSVIFGAGTFLTVLDNDPFTFGILAKTSTDLVTWAQSDAGFPLNAANQRVFLPVFGNGVFLVVSQNSAAYATSPDGSTWTQQSSYVPTSWGQPVFDGVKFVATVIGVAATPKIATSTDGIHWTESTATLTAAFSGGSTPLFVGNAGTAQYIAAESADDAGNSLDGALTVVTPFNYNDSGAPTGWTPVFSGSSWARCNGSNADLVSSSDGLTWKQDTVPATARGWSNVAFGAGHFIAVGSDNSGNNMLATRGP